MKIVRLKKEKFALPSPPSGVGIGELFIKDSLYKNHYMGKMALEDFPM